MASWQLLPCTVSQACGLPGCVCSLGQVAFFIQNVLLETPLRQQEGKRAGETASTCLIGFRKLFPVSCRFEVGPHNRGPSLSSSLGLCLLYVSQMVQGLFLLQGTTGEHTVTLILISMSVTRTSLALGFLARSARSGAEGVR